jgi:hypothetical protein
MLFSDPLGLMCQHVCLRESDEFHRWVRTCKMSMCVRFASVYLAHDEQALTFFCVSATPGIRL